MVAARARKQANFRLIWRPCMLPDILVHIRGQAHPGDMVGEILKQGGERLQNPSTPRLSTTTTIFLKTIKERRPVL